MVDIEIYRDMHCNIVKFVCDGHTDYAESGSDIVCASVSSVAYAVLCGIEKVLKIDFGYEQGDGYLFFVLPDDIELKDRENINILLDTMYLFFCDLRDSYPDNIKISELEV